MVHLLRQICHSLSEADFCFLWRYGEEYDFVKVLDFGIVKAASDVAGAGPPHTRDRARDWWATHQPVSTS